jgi:hypothetical protein
MCCGVPAGTEYLFLLVRCSTVVHYQGNTVGTVGPARLDLFLHDSNPASLHSTQILHIVCECPRLV